MNQIFSGAFSVDEFKARRQRVAAAIGEDAFALLQGAPRPASPHPIFAQSKVFGYLCGIAIERAYLLIDGKGARTTLFVPDDGLSNLPGGVLNDEARNALCTQSGIDAVESVASLIGALGKIRTLYLLQRPDEVIFASKFGLMGVGRLRVEDPLDGGLRRDQLLMEKIRARFPKIKIGELEPIIADMRLIKSPAEIEVLRCNGQMAAQACIEAMKSTAPGVGTGVLHGIADYVFRLMGNCGHAYDFIIEPSHPASDTLLDGDLVLVDCAPDCGGYTMDIARMWPVNGVFDAWQRHTCGLIAEYHKTLLARTRAGALVADIYREAAEHMRERYRGDAAGSAILENMITRGVRYFNHHVGLSAHDAVCPWQDEPLRAGMVMVVDPMVWLEDAPHGYVRVEDTLVVTEDGYESLTGSVPFELDAIERLMVEPGQFPICLSSGAIAAPPDLS